MLRRQASLTPVYDDGQVAIYLADCREILPEFLSVDAVITDPPYGDTSLDWDEPTDGRWIEQAAALTNVMWCFGSMRFWLEQGHRFRAGWRYGQEIVWEKHNGSSFHADRFKRVHEFAVQWYRGEWGAIHKDPPVTFDATPRTVRRKQRPPHTGHIEAGSYTSEDGGPRLMRSVLQVRSEHGRAVHPTQKPIGIVRPLVEYSCPVDGVVLDPFMGSGTTLLAARELGRRAIGIEVNPEYVEKAIARLAQGVLDAA